MYIQYRGFSLDATSRIYAYHVIDSSQGAREFTVEVQNAAFRSPLLRIQDGPGICYAHLKQELDRETIESPTDLHLRIGQTNIQDYVERTHPKTVKKWGAGVKP